MPGGHLRRLVVGHVALNLIAQAALLRLIVFQELLDALRLALQSPNPLLLPFLVRIAAPPIFFPLLPHRGFHFRFQIRLLLL